MNLKGITENKYTFSDIFENKHEIWLVVPLIIYMLTPIVHIVSYIFTYSEVTDQSALIHMLGTGENLGDYYVAIIKYAFIIGLFVALIGLLSTIVANKRKLRVSNKIDGIPFCFFAMYLLLICISSVVNKIGFTEYVLGFSNRAEGVSSVFCYFIVFYLCGSLIRNEKFKNIIIWMFLTTSMVIGILSIINKYFKDLYIIGNNGFCGIFYHWNFYAYYLTMVIMLSASVAVLGKNRISRIFAYGIMCFNTVLLAINDSLGGFLASVVAFVFLIIAASIKKKRVSTLAIIELITFLGIVFVVGLFTPSFFSELTTFGSDVVKIVENTEDAGNAGTARWTLWTHTVKYIKQRPWIGWGYEGTCGMLGAETHADRTHNEYLENMAFYGIPAGIIYVLGLISIYVKALIKNKQVDNSTLCCMTGALAYIGSAFVGNSFIFTAPFFFILLGLANNTYQVNNQNMNFEESDYNDELKSAEDNSDPPADF